MRKHVKSYPERNSKDINDGDVVMIESNSNIINHRNASLCFYVSKTLKSNSLTAVSSVNMNGVGIHFIYISMSVATPYDMALRPCHNPAFLLSKHNKKYEQILSSEEKYIGMNYIMEEFPLGFMSLFLEYQTDFK